MSEYFIFKTDTLPPTHNLLFLFREYAHKKVLSLLDGFFDNLGLGSKMPQTLKKLSNYSGQRKAEK